jgi:DNA-binding CsgD family transcriptional regulator
MEQLVGQLYEAIAGPEGVAGILSILARAFDSNLGAIQQYDHQARRALMPACFPGGFERPAREYEAHFAERNVWKEHGRHRYRPGRVIKECELCPDRILLASEFYNDWLRHQDARFSVALVLEVDCAIATTLTLLRRNSAGTYEQDEVDLLQQLLPHVQNLFGVQRRLAQAEALAVTGGAGLERMGTGLGLFDALGRMIYASPLLETLLERRDGVTVSQGTLIGTSHPDSDRLRLAVLRAIDTHQRRGSAAWAALRLPRPSGAADLQALVCPLPPLALALGFSRPAAAVFVHDPDRPCLAGTPHALQQFFGLTAAEAEVLALIVEGNSVQDSAECLGVSVSTVRTHLKRIMVKTGAARQSDLVRMVLRGPGPLVPRGCGEFPLRMGRARRG